MADKVPAPLEEVSPLDGIIDFGAGPQEEDHQLQPGLQVKRGDDPIELPITSESYPAPLRDNQGPR